MPLDIDASHWIETNSSALEALIGPGAILVDDCVAAAFEIVRLPDMTLPTGELVVTDTLYLGAVPFVQRLPPGPAPMRLVLAGLRGNAARVAFAVAGTFDRPVVRFEVAKLAIADEAVIDKRDLRGCVIDSGFASFTSPEAHAEFERLCDRAAFEIDILAEYELAMRSAEGPAGSWATCRMDAGTIATFATGAPFGIYRSFAGFDEAGACVVIMTDFDIVTWKRRPADA